MLGDDEPLVGTEDSKETMKQWLLQWFEKYAKNICLGSSERIAQADKPATTKNQEEAKGDEVTYGKYKWMTYQQVKEYSIALGKYIIKEDICPEVEEQESVHWQTELYK